MHVRAPSYDVAGFLAGRDPLEPFEVDAVGDVRGRSLLHLQCHFGLDTLAWARRGARVTGVDFSRPALEAARGLAERAGLADRARFVEADVLELDLGEAFDVAYASRGVLLWLSDLDAWGRVVARHLKPGGTFLLHESHPAALMFAAGPDGALRLASPYFHQDAPTVTQGTDYADPAYAPQTETHEWSWALQDVLGALLRAGLVLEEFRELDRAFWRMWPHLTQRAPGEWVQPEGAPALPLAFWLRARKPADAPRRFA